MGTSRAKTSSTSQMAQDAQECQIIPNFHWPTWHETSEKWVGQRSAQLVD